MTRRASPRLSAASEAGEQGAAVAGAGLRDYLPTARPGHRAPHDWIEVDGRRITTLDLFGEAFVALVAAERAGPLLTEGGIPVRSHALPRRCTSLVRARPKVGWCSCAPAATSRGAAPLRRRIRTRGCARRSGPSLRPDARPGEWPSRPPSRRLRGRSMDRRRHATRLSHLPAKVGTGHRDGSDVVASSSSEARRVLARARRVSSARR